MNDKNLNVPVLLKNEQISQNCSLKHNNGCHPRGHLGVRFFQLYKSLNELKLYMHMVRQCLYSLYNQNYKKDTSFAPSSM